MASLNEVNEKIFSTFSLDGILSGVGWLFLGILILGVGGFFIWWYWNKRVFNRNITDFELVGDVWEPTFRDVAKLAKLGKGGFAVLYIKKLKAYRIAFGGRVGKNTYYFFIDKDGYPYNCVLHGRITLDGTIPIKTTNPLMRAQYTALEKQIDELTKGKKDFWTQYGNWVMSITFILIMGVIMWLTYREMKDFWGQAAGIAKELKETAQILKGGVASNPPNPNSGIYEVG